jgi:hypothetical protein
MAAPEACEAVMTTESSTSRCESLLGSRTPSCDWPTYSTPHVGRMPRNRELTLLPSATWQQVAITDILYPSIYPR